MLDAIISAKNIHKHYAGTHALSDVDFEIRSGEIVGLIGENGAGKSTLMRIICGIEHPSTGTLTVRGKPTEFSGPHAAQADGIAMIPQEVLLVDELTVVENIFLGHEISGATGLSKAKMRSAAQEILDELDCTHIAPTQLTGSLPKGSQQMVAIARRVMQGGAIFVMDEPTSSLTGSETEALFRLLRKLKARGKSSVFISHRLEEMLEICDRIVVLRDGKLVGDFPNDGLLTKDVLVSSMVGSDMADEFSRKISEKGDVILEAKNIAVRTFQGRKTPTISFKARSGEVVGITGLAGVGKTELAHVLSGLREPVSGDICLHGKVTKLTSPVTALKNKIGLVSDDRRSEGLVLGMAALANMTFTSLRKYLGLLGVNRKAEHAMGLSMTKKLSMKPEYLARDANLLSGGNQQKVVIIRQLCSESEVLLMDEPTKGIDIGAKSEVYQLVGNLVAEGKTAVLFSSEPQEILGVCDTIFVLTDRSFFGPYARGDLDYAKLMAIEFGTVDTESMTKETINEYQ
ncbi:sugar ABC transporter ATP-binding protein [Ahrensia kielensis]|uniref:Sugar ABC transporter ATP-binding protein n=1 Tax=Ahrensia kielensis TaxID=76980 RepID=A0ABU9TAF0_9HYPH